MKAKIGWQIVMGVLVATLGMVANGLEAKVSTETVMNEAKAKISAGDLESAAVIYYRALQTDNPDPKIRQALAELLIKVHADEPEAVHTDLLEAIEDNAPDASLS